MRKADILDAAAVTAAVTGADVVVSAFGPVDETPDTLVTAAQTLLQALPAAGVRRLLVVGGASSLEVAPGVLLFDTPEFPAAWKPIANAHRQALEMYRQNTTLDWTCISPAAMISPGTRTGKFRLGGDQLLVDAEGNSAISIEDYAVALLDEIENPRSLRKRITVAY